MDSSTLYVTDLPRSIEETDLQKALVALGVTSFRKVTMARNRRDGSATGNAYISFYNRESAMDAYHRLFGKVIPDSKPPVRFFLTHTDIKGGRPQQLCLWVGNLPETMDDEDLAMLFGSRFESVLTVVVLKNKLGQSRGFGFVRFSDVVEHSEALTQMDGFRLESGEQLKVIPAEPKRIGSIIKPSVVEPHPSEAPLTMSAKIDSPNDDEVDANTLVDHSLPPDVEALNRELMEETREFWETVDHASWLAVPKSSSAEEGPDAIPVSWETIDPIADENSFFSQLV